MYVVGYRQYDAKHVCSVYSNIENLVLPLSELQALRAGSWARILYFFKSNSNEQKIVESEKFVP